MRFSADKGLSAEMSAAVGYLAEKAKLSRFFGEMPDQSFLYWWLEMQRNLFVVRRLGSPVVLSYLDAGFEPRCGRKDFLLACCCCYCFCLLLLLLLAAAAC